MTDMIMIIIAIGVLAAALPAAWLSLRRNREEAEARRMFEIYRNDVGELVKAYRGDAPTVEEWIATLRDPADRPDDLGPRADLLTSTLGLVGSSRLPSRSFTFTAVNSWLIRHIGVVLASGTGIALLVCAVAVRGIFGSVLSTVTMVIGISFLTMAVRIAMPGACQRFYRRFGQMDYEDRLLWHRSDPEAEDRVRYPDSMPLWLTWLIRLHPQMWSAMDECSPRVERDWRSR